MAYYNCLLLDVDGTLLDFEAAEHKAFMETMEHFRPARRPMKHWKYTLTSTRAFGQRWKKGRSNGQAGGAALARLLEALGKQETQRR